MIEEESLFVTIVKEVVKWTDVLKKAAEHILEKENANKKPN